MARRASSGAMDKVLTELGVEVSTAAKQALYEGAKVILADAKSRITNTSGMSIGKLSDSGKLVVNKRGNVIKIVFDAETDGYKYGRIVEFRPGHEHPYLYPAYDAHRAQIKESVVDAIRQAVSRLAVS